MDHVIRQHFKQQDVYFEILIFQKNIFSLKLITFDLRLRNEFTSKVIPKIYKIFHTFFCFQVDCQNYIRVLAKTEDDRLLVCGTNAYDPRCRYYSHNETHTSVDQEFSGKGFCPYDPRHNSTFLYTGKWVFSLCMYMITQWA